VIAALSPNLPAKLADRSASGETVAVIGSNVFGLNGYRHEQVARMGPLLLYAAVQIGVPLAFVVALALRWLYLRGVRRSMLRSVAAAPADEAAPALAEPPARPLAIVASGVPPRASVRSAWRGPSIAVAVHVCAGFAYALVVTLVWVHVAGADDPWDGVALFSLFYAWPLVIVVSLVATVTWRAAAFVVLTYAALFIPAVALMMQGTTLTVAEVAYNWWNINGIGTLLVLAFLARPIKAMGPIVVALMMAAVAGVFESADVLSNPDVSEWVATLATSLGLGGTGGGYTAIVVVFGGAALAAALIAYVLLRLIGRLYRKQWISDQSIQIDAVWLVFAIMHAPTQQPFGGLVAFLVYELVARIGLRLFQPRGKADAHAPRLLLLRVFALGSRSESLFRSFSLLWRYTGSMRMIAGPDLANATVEPHEFLDFLAGRLQRRFITGPAVLEQRLAESELRRDPDGRFRVSTFFCHADTWQSVLRRLARESDLVLMDLRGFTSANQGCIFELNELLDAVRLRHLLLLVDDTTDEAFLTEVLQQGWRRISAGSPNRADAAPQVRLYRLAESGATGIGTLVATLASVHSGKLAPVAR